MKFLQVTNLAAAKSDNYNYNMDLTLSLKTRWFEMTDAGIKHEDYRSITGYWCSRFLLFQNRQLTRHQWDLMILANGGPNYIFLNLDSSFFFKSFDHNIMTLGYPSKDDISRRLKYKHKGIEIRTGNPEWGAEPNKLYFVIMHGERV